jgi:hypothetical protein
VIRGRFVSQPSIRITHARAQWRPALVSRSAQQLTCVKTAVPAGSNPVGTLCDQAGSHEKHRGIPFWLHGGLDTDLDLYRLGRLANWLKAVQPVSDHKFRVGLWVSYAPPGERRIVYTIVQLLPPEGGECRYRIKAADEPHERVVREAELRDASRLENES